MNERRQKYNVPENWEKTCDGAGCRCGAWNSGECGCDVDWTPHETYRMMVELNFQQEEIERLRGALERARRDLRCNCTLGQIWLKNVMDDIEKALAETAK